MCTVKVRYNEQRIYSDAFIREVFQLESIGVIVSRLSATLQYFPITFKINIRHK